MRIRNIRHYDPSDIVPEDPMHIAAMSLAVVILSRLASTDLKALKKKNNGLEIFAADVLNFLEQTDFALAPREPDIFQ